MHRKQKLTNIYIVRHGQTRWNVKGLLQGHKDSPLTALGIKQAEQIRDEFKHIHFDAIFSSDLVRAKRTAKIIALERKIAVKTTQVLRERCFGTFEGKPFAEFNQALQKLIERYAHLTEEEHFHLKIAHDVESPAEAVARFITFLRETAVAFSEKTILVVSHGGTMRNLLIHLGFAANQTLPAGSIENTGYIKLESDGVDFFIKETKGIKKHNSPIPSLIKPVLSGVEGLRVG